MITLDVGGLSSSRPAVNVELGGMVAVHLPCFPAASSGGGGATAAVWFGPADSNPSPAAYVLWVVTP